MDTNKIYSTLQDYESKFKGFETKIQGFQTLDKELGETKNKLTKEIAAKDQEVKALQKPQEGQTIDSETLEKASTELKTLNDSFQKNEDKIKQFNQDLQQLAIDYADKEWEFDIAFSGVQNAEYNEITFSINQAKKTVLTAFDNFVTRMKLFINNQRIKFPSQIQHEQMLQQAQMQQLYQSQQPAQPATSEQVVSNQRKNIQQIIKENSGK